MVRAGVLFLLVTASAHAGFRSCATALLPVPLPIVNPSRPCISGLACLRSVAAYWGIIPPPEGALGYRVLQRARQLLGDRELVRLANIHVSYPMNHPDALAAAARDLGLRARQEYRLEWHDLVRDLARGETVLVMWQLEGDLTLRWSAVQAIVPGKITLMEPTESQIRGGTTLYDIETEAFVRAWQDSVASQGTVIRIIR